MIKRLDFFAKVQVSFNLTSSQDIQSQNEKFQNSLMFTLHRVYCTFAVHHEKAWSSFFKISTDKLFCNLKSGKINCCFGKKVGKKSWILDPNICAKPVFKTFGIHHCCFGDISFQERKIICSSATASQTDNTLPFIIIFYDDVLFSWIILLQCNFPFLFLFCRMMPIT